MNSQMFDSNNSFKGQVGGQRFTGLMMIGTGVIFLLAMSGVQILGFSPWILMALLPLLWSLVTAVRNLVQDRRVTLRVIIPLLVPFAIVGVVALSMAGLNLGQYWPVMAIALGAYFIFKR